MKRIMIGAAMCAALAACSGGGSGPAAVLTDFAGKMTSGSCSGLRDSLAASARDTFGPKIEQACTMEAEARKTAPKQKAARSFNVLEERIEGDRATVRIETVFDDNTKEAGEPVTMVREDGRWKIDLLAGLQSQMGGGGMTPSDPAAPGPMAPAPSEPTAPAATAPTAEPAEEGAGEEDKQ